MGLPFSKSDVDDNTYDEDEDPNFCAQERSVPVYKSWSLDDSAKDSIDTQNKCVEFHDLLLTRENVRDIKSCLDLQDKMSLIYLLYEDSQADTALRLATRLVEGAQLDILDEWIADVTCSQGTQWKSKLLEALSIIQHYQALRILGHTKEKINIRFLPTVKDTSFHIPLTNKLLYQMLESFQDDEMEKFLDILENDFQKKNYEFKRFDYSEMYLLYWTSIKYISTENISNIETAHRIMEINLIEEEKQKSQINEHDRNVKVQNLEQSYPVATTSIKDTILENSYNISPDFPGICLIINQEKFYTEEGSQYKDLAPTIVHDLESRTGTEVDKNRLISVFKNFNYEVIEKNDLTHSKMKEAIESAVKLVKNHSSLFVCILSHGLEGEVFGVNTVAVKIDDIKEIICTKNRKNLGGKPKVLILQTCQGDRFQEVNDDDEHDYATDGPPSAADFFTFYATIPGFASLRHKKTGTWFIQAFCDKMETHSVDLHFDDICTLAQQEVMKMRWKSGTSTRAMVPMKTSTLTKFFYLPRINISK